MKATIPQTQNSNTKADHVKPRRSYVRSGKYRRNKMETSPLPANPSQVFLINAMPTDGTAQRMEACFQSAVTTLLPTAKIVSLRPGDAGDTTLLKFSREQRHPRQATTILLDSVDVSETRERVQPDKKTRLRYLLSLVRCIANTSAPQPLVFCFYVEDDGIFDASHVKAFIDAGACAMLPLSSPVEMIANTAERELRRSLFVINSPIPSADKRDGQP